MRVGVVGGGAVGVTTARDLATRGADVTLFERERVAAGSSGRAAGVCYDAFSDRRDAALGRRALERFRALDGTGAFRFVDRPYVWLARTGDDRREGAIREQVPRMREHGVDVSLLDPDRLGERFPALVTDDVAVAAVAEDAGATDPRAYTRTMAERAREAGVRVRENTPASLGDGPVVTTGGGDPERFDAVVVAAGAHTARLLAHAGIEIPVKPYRVQALETEPVAVDAPMLYDATGGYYLRPRDGGLLVGDGTEPVERDPDDWEADADDWFREDCRRYEEQALGRSWPAERAWAGLCTATPDGDPLVGPVGADAPAVHVATGWQGHGFMLAPATAERLAAQVLGEAGIRGFEPTRFDGDEPFEIVEGMALDER